MRPLNDSDVSTMIPWVNDLELTKYLTLGPPISEEQERDWLASVTQSETDAVFGIVVRESNIYIGNIDLHNIDRNAGTADIGIFIGAIDQQGKGYGTEAVRLIVAYACCNLGIKNIRAVTFAQNLQSIALFEKTGFKKEGTIPRDFCKNGGWVDSIVYTCACSEGC